MTPRVRYRLLSSLFSKGEAEEALRLSREFAAVLDRRRAREARAADHQDRADRERRSR